MSDSETNQPRYIVGIDLGTTNSAMCFTDTRAVDSQVVHLPVTQVVSAGETEARDSLPSFHYSAAEGEFPQDALKLPWSSESPINCVGVFARDHGAFVPTRQIASAKSWLCHAGIDRTAAVLPWQAPEDAERLSPVEASSRYLEHMRRMWDHTHRKHPLAEQTVVLTIPASFDEVARNLTVRAAQIAGLPRVLLIEEPQAAFYAWMHRHQNDWSQRVTPGQKILICDVGGGTSDFTLIRVKSGRDGTVAFHRVSVGEHLILGGDNLDLALAVRIEQQFKREGVGELTPRQWGVLVRLSRQLKETLLSENAPDRLTVSLPGSGSKLIGGSLQTELMRDDIQRVLIDGFLPKVELTAKPDRTQSGFREFGLPYAGDSAITRYLAEFLTSHAEIAASNEILSDDNNPARPDIVLFNGGLFASPLLRQRMVDVISGWFRSDSDPNWSPILLEGDRLDLAVARGAACFGLVRCGKGTRISAGLPRTYYIGAATDHGTKAVCLIPAGTEPGDEAVSPDLKFALITGQPAEFPVYFSGTRLTDAVGTTFDVDGEQLTALPPIRTVLRDNVTDDVEDAGTHRTVTIHGRLTEIGTLDLWCSSADDLPSKRWKLQFDVRSAVRTDVSAVHGTAAEAEGVVDEDTREAVRGFLESVFADAATERPSGLARRLGMLLNQSRNDWPTSLLRDIWQTLIELEPGRRRSPQHESQWLNLLGFCLRPGFGYALDDWRIDTTWDTLNGRLVNSTPECRAQWWIMWRRIAGGLNRGRQSSLATPLVTAVRQTARQAKTGRGKSIAIALHQPDSAEIWRVLGAFEQLPAAERHELGDNVVAFASRKKFEAVSDVLHWTLGRIGSRVPASDDPQAVVSRDVVAEWLRDVLSRDPTSPSALLAVMEMARRTDDRFRDLPAPLREQAADWLEDHDAPTGFVTLVREGGETDSETTAAILGDQLPPGLRLHV